MNNYFKIITKDAEVTFYFTKEKGNYINFQNKNTKEVLEYKRTFSIQKIKEIIGAAIEGGFNMWRDTTKFLSKEEGGETAIQAVPNEIYLVGKSNTGGEWAVNVTLPNEEVHFFEKLDENTEEKEVYYDPATGDWLEVVTENTEEKEVKKALWTWKWKKRE